MADNALSPDAAEQGPAADGPIITPELRRAVVRLAHADADPQAAAERVAELRTADHLDRPAPARNDTDRALLGRYADDRRVTGTAPHFRLGDGRAVWVVNNPIGRGQAWAAGTDGTHGTAEVINSTHYVCEAAITAAFDDADRAAAAERVGTAVRATLADLDRPYAIGDRVALIALPSRTGSVVGLGTGRPDGIIDVRWDKPWNGVEVSGDWRCSFRRIDGQPAADLDMADPHTYAPATCYAATHDAQPAPAASDPVAAIVDLIEQYGTGRVSAAIATAGGHVNSAGKYNADAVDLLDRVRRTLADALGTRRDRERYAVLMSVGARPVACEHGYGVFDSCSVCDNTDNVDPAPVADTVAVVTVNDRGGLMSSSTITIGDATAAVPERTETAGMFAPHRIVAAMRSLGYVPVDYYGQRPSPETLTITFDVRPIGGQPAVDPRTVGERVCAALIDLADHGGRMTPGDTLPPDDMVHLLVGTRLAVIDPDPLTLRLTDAGRHAAELARQSS